MELKEMLNLWVKITGVNPEEEKTKYTISFDDHLTDWDIKKMDEKIKAALSYDETGLFATAYLAHYFTEYLKQRKLNAYELVTDQVTEEYIQDLKSLYNALKSSDAEHLIMDEAQRAMAYYGLPFSLSVFDVVELRTSATRCIDSLRTVQFSTGEPSKEGFRVVKEICMYRNIGDVVTSALNNFINGVALCYIREEDLASSYFAFMIKNGENLYLLTDKPVYKHPLQKHMTRCPGRRMEERISSTFFPYSLTNIDMSDMYYSGRYAVKEKDTSLACKDADDNVPIKLGTFSDMEGEEAFWVVMMLSLIKTKFYDNHFQCPELSYVGNMIHHPALQRNNNEIALYSQLPSIDLDEILAPDKVELNYNRDSRHLFDYIVDRFKDKVSPEMVNHIGNSDVYLPDKKLCSRKQMKAFSVNDFGTAAEVKYQQAWITRYNMAVAIQNMNEEEFHQNGVRIRESYIAEVEKNRMNIIRMAIRGELIHRKLVSQDTFGFVLGDEEECFCKKTTFDNWYENDNGYPVGNKKPYDKADYRCIVSGSQPSLVLVVKPNSAADLALLIGRTVEELPEQLRHWSKERVYTGNSILENIDPFDWVISDEYWDLSFKFAFCISKRAYASLCKEAGIENDKFWKKIKPVCYEEKYSINGCAGKYKDGDEPFLSYVLLQKCQKCKWFKDNMYPQKENK